MHPSLPTSALQLRSLVRPEGVLELSLAEVPVPVPAAHEVLVRMQASPVNPSDIGNMFGGADLATVQAGGSPDRPVVTAQVPPAAMQAMAGRVGQALPVGNEGAGVVVAAGASPAAQALLGKTVAIMGGGMYAQYRTMAADQCLLLPEGTTAAEGASAFINPLTALGMVETMRREGHRALVHTAAASNLGQILNRVCQADGIALVNIVRSQAQVELLKAAGATHVCNMAAPDFLQELTDALAATGATIAFDATGGGGLAGQILGCMEKALTRGATTYSRYGSTTHKQVYIYGHLDTRPTEFKSNFGSAWGMGGWLVFPYLEKIGAEASRGLRERVGREILTTFASRYAREVSLVGMLGVEVIEGFGRRGTGGKVLVRL